MVAVSVVKVAPHIAQVTIERPEARNAINAEVAQALEAAVKQVEADEEIWVAVLNGAGGAAFCSGADLKEVAAGGMANLYTADGAFGGFVKYPRAKVWIAAVDGFALAGGFEIALSCDLIVASEGSVFGLSEVTRGLIAAAGGASRLVRALPRAIALELLVTGGVLDVDKAAAFGLINRTAPKGRAVDVALELARAICANAPIAVRETLKVARQSYDLDDDTLFALALEGQDRIFQTADFSEGTQAFVEKRKPDWQGR